MSQLLDDEFQLDLVEQLAKERNARIKYATIFVVLGTVWGLLLPWFADLIRSIGSSLLLILGFFGICACLLGAYAFKVLAKNKVPLIYTVVSFFLTLGCVILIDNEFGREIRSLVGPYYQLGVIAFIAALIPVGFTWVMPLHYKKTEIGHLDLLKIKEANVFKDRLQYSIVFCVLMILWGWGFYEIEDVFRDNPISKYLSRNLSLNSAASFYILITLLLVYLYKVLFGVTPLRALSHSVLELFLIYVLLSIIYLALLYFYNIWFRDEYLLYVNIIIVFTIVATTYRRIGNENT
ncbi:MAG: hypothetical protein GY810_06420 [Aureispira sp.]|nr:hypothetical protein [Aureispira sp.]